MSFPAGRIETGALLSAVLAAGCGCVAAGPPDAIQYVPLVTTRADGVADSQVVPVRYQGRDAWLALDTGAPFSFLFAEPGGPEYVEQAGTVELAGESWTLPGYGDDAIGVELFQGRPIVGLLGLDFFLDRPSAIDYPAGRLERGAARPQHGERERLTILKLRGFEHAHALVEVLLDGRTRTLMFDTGAHDTLLLGDAAGSNAGPDEAEVEVQTADGTTWPVRAGQGRLLLPGAPPCVIPVLRAQSIGYLSPMLEELGAEGLLGLTALGWRRIEFDFQAGELRLGGERRE